MKVEAKKIERIYLHLTFDSKSDRDKFYDYIETMMKRGE